MQSGHWLILVLPQKFWFDYRYLIGIPCHDFNQSITTKKALITLTVMQGLTLLLFVPLTLGYTSKLIVYLAIFGYFIANPGLIATISTLIMDRAANMPAKATFFSLQLSLVVFMGFVYSALSLTLAQHIGYTAVVILTFVAALGVAVLAWKILPSDAEYPAH